MLSGSTAALGVGALIAAVVLAVLVAWALSRVGSQPGATSHSAAASRTSPAATVEVSAESLVGRPIAVVRQQLLQLGLAVRVLWQPSDQDPGTVLSVQPSGQVPAGSMIAVTVASQPRHHGHGHGDGQGNSDGGG